MMSFIQQLVDEEFKKNCEEKLIKILARAEIKGEITMIEAVFVKESFKKGKDLI